MSLNPVVYRRNSLLAQPRIRRHPIVSKNALKFPFGESAMSPTTWSQQLLPWIILIFCLIGYSLNETASPLNIAAARGTKVQLNCSSSEKNQAAWFFKNFTDVEEQEIYVTGITRNENPMDQYSVNVSSEGNFNLIFNVSQSSSGIFRCRSIIADDRDNHLKAQVVALDPRPQCSMEYDSGGVTAKCSIGFSGYWSPKLEWRNAGVTLETNVTKTTLNSHVNSSVTVPFNKIDSRASYILTCTPKFSLENIPPDTTAKNIPEYPNSCTVTIDPRPTEPPKPTLKQPSNAQSKGENDTKSNTGDSVSAHNWHSLYLCQCFAASVLNGMLHKWLGQ